MTEPKTPNVVTFTLNDAQYEALVEYATHEDREPDKHARHLVIVALNLYEQYKPAKRPSRTTVTDKKETSGGTTPEKDKSSSTRPSAVISNAS